MLELNFHPFPELESERLLLRRLEEEDAERMYFLRSDPAILRYLGKEPAPSVKAALDFIRQILINIDNNESILWGIAEKEQPGKLIGTICIWQIRPENYRADLGYVLDPAFWGRGYMKEAIGKVLDYGFNKLGLHSFEAQVDPDNKASTGLLEKCNFTREGYFRENFHFKGKFTDTAVYSLVASSHSS